MSYISSVMTCRSTVNGFSLGEKLSKLIVQDLEEVDGANKDHLNTNLPQQEAFPLEPICMFVEGKKIMSDL
jgi:hypothetical protein